MRFPNWVCKDCGKPFSRKWNGKRHINICHHGFGTLLSFIDYLSGRQFGIYPPNSPPSYRRKSTSVFDIYMDELNRALARESVNRFSSYRSKEYRIILTISEFRLKLIITFQMMQTRYLELEHMHAKNA